MVWERRANQPTVKDTAMRRERFRYAAAAWQNGGKRTRALMASMAAILPSGKAMNTFFGSIRVHAIGEAIERFLLALVDGDGHFQFTASGGVDGGGCPKLPPENQRAAAEPHRHPRRSPACRFPRAHLGRHHRRVIRRHSRTRRRRARHPSAAFQIRQAHHQRRHGRKAGARVLQARRRIPRLPRTRHGAHEFLRPRPRPHPQGSPHPRRPCREGKHRRQRGAGGDPVPLAGQAVVRVRLRNGFGSSPSSL